MNKSVLLHRIRLLFHFPFKIIRAAETRIRVTNMRRWKKNVYQKPSWDERNKKVAIHIPLNATVIDFGAGAQTMRKYLPSGTKYQPCDLVQTTSDTLVCDFNKGSYPEVQEVFDYLISSGVLEYIQDLADHISRLHCYANKALITYNAAVGRKGELLDRLEQGWVNNLSKVQLENLFENNKISYTLIDTWEGHLIYKLTMPGKI